MLEPRVDDGCRLDLKPRPLNSIHNVYPQKDDDLLFASVPHPTYGFRQSKFRKITQPHVA